MPRGFRDPNRDQAELFTRAMDRAGPPRAPEEGADRPATVIELTRTIKDLLETNVGRVWVEGEVSNLSAPRSGHLYFTLKDEYAAIGCVMWRSTVARLRVRPEDGMRVTVRGRVTVYEPQGRYQIVCESVQSVGRGELRRRFEELVDKLRAEGLFDPGRKRPLPAVPGTVGLVTSPTGAAVRDMIRILRARLPGVRIVLSPCRVQGAGAAEDIVRALGRLDAAGLCDMILLGRGGGSLEDLWPFNEEAVARAVARCATPVVSAVGNETDLSITDLVADRRAATPSEAAQIAAPEAQDLRAALHGHAQRLRVGLQGCVREARGRVEALAGRPVLRDPATLVGLKAQRIDELAARLRAAGRIVVEERRSGLALAGARLEALSPLAVLGRGYSITTLANKRRVVRDAGEVTMGADIETRLARGRLRSRVTDARAHDEHPGAQEQSG